MLTSSSITLANGLHEGIDEVDVNAWWGNFVRLFLSVLIPKKLTREPTLTGTKHKRGIPNNQILFSPPPKIARAQS